MLVLLPRCARLHPTKKARASFLIEHGLAVLLIALIVVFKHTAGRVSRRVFVNIGYVFCGIVVLAFVQALVVLLIESAQSCRAKCKKPAHASEKPAGATKLSVKIKPFSLREDNGPSSARPLTAESARDSLRRNSSRGLARPTTAAEEEGVGGEERAPAAQRSSSINSN